MLDHPVALTTYHVLISKSHPHARTILYYMNSSLEKLRESGEYDRIVERHLARFWEAQGSPNPALSVMPAARPTSTPAPPKDAPAAPSPIAGSLPVAPPEAKAEANKK